MESNIKENPQGKGLGSGRWYWEAIKQAKTKEDFQSVLAQVYEKVGDDDVTLTLHIPGSAYVRIMGNAWLAKQCGEIDEISLTAYADRAFALMELTLKSIATRKKH
ncbi:hypothetical protein ES708_03671 [subsurface metagenome]